MMSPGEKPVKIKVLYADDDSDDRDMFSEALKQVCSDPDLEVAVNGVDALKKIKKFSPDIIFLDINMPLKSGKDVLKLIRADIFYKTTPVIMLSTSCNDEDVKMTFESEANYYAVKPGSFEDLVNILKNIFSKFNNGRIHAQKRDEYLINHTANKALS